MATKCNTMARTIPITTNKYNITGNGQTHVLITGPATGWIAGSPTYIMFIISEFKCIESVPVMCYTKLKLTDSQC